MILEELPMLLEQLLTKPIDIDLSLFFILIIHYYCLIHSVIGSNYTYC